MPRPGPQPHNDGVPPVAARQGGVFTPAQAITAGWTARQIRRRRDSGRWVPVTGRVLTTAGAPLDTCALAWSAQLTWPEVRTLAGLRVTTRQRTAVDCLGWLEIDEAIDLWAWVSSRQLLTREQLAQACLDRVGWRGTPQLLALLKLVRRGAASRAELRLHQLLDAAGITGWEAGVALGDAAGVIGVADVLFRAQRVVVEVDGWRAHGSRTAFEHDRRRQNRLVAAGYIVLRVTWDQLVNDPHRFLADLRRVLASRR